MATCRVYLCTYRRSQLLRRALESLLKQTFTDWICELHNDDPLDPGPRLVAEEFGDPRVSVVDHAENLGTTRTFNLVYQPVAEEFVSLLEDDNWWEPDFLAVMMRELRAHPQASMAWANMEVWREEPDGSWTDTGHAIWVGECDDSCRLVEFPDVRQLGGALHSNGAMLLRASRAPRYTIPVGTPYAAVEPVRERAFDYPILFVPAVLANFAVTLQTSRERDLSTWNAIQALLHASFLRNVPLRPETLAAVWARARSGTRTTNPLLLSGLLRPGARAALSHARFDDWVRLLLSFIRHPIVMTRTVRRLMRHTPVEEFLEAATAERVRVARERGFVAL
jgi:glycosyltransferase involved in cell wall biosynthesis